MWRFFIDKGEPFLYIHAVLRTIQVSCFPLLKEWPTRTVNLKHEGGIYENEKIPVSFLVAYSFIH